MQKKKHRKGTITKIKGSQKYRKIKSQTLEACWGTKESHLPAPSPFPINQIHPPIPNPSGLEANLA